MNITMKKKLIVTSLLAASVFASAANAANGTINVTGKITASPCSIDTAKSTATLDLGSINLNSKDTIPAEKEITISLKDCPFTAQTATVKFTGTADGDNFKFDGGAKGYALQLIDIDGSTPIKSNVDANAVHMTGQATHDLKYKAKFIKTGTAITDFQAASQTTGDVNVSLNYEITFN
ncbi:putative fimbrial protein [Yersinia enterocolitica]|uniref:fimbrial protein n=1 Tax=Yersinia enterocolitica TaxID=630 RepID=UPI0005DFAB69|nr:fimbrial protein [Yersinia enterocolitica]CNG80128.1 putative fimbrial protein [Yersinia enterocolitica]